MATNAHNPNDVCPRKQRVDKGVDVYAMFNDIKENMPQGEYVLETPQPIVSKNSLNVMGTKCVRNRVAKIDNTKRFIKPINKINKRGQVHVGIKPKAYSNDAKGINVALTHKQWEMLYSVDIDSHINAEGIKMSSKSVRDSMAYVQDKINRATMFNHKEYGNVDIPVMVSHQYMQCFRREHKVTEMAIRLCVAHGMVIEDSEYGFNNGSIESNTESKCRAYKIAPEIEQEVIEDLKQDKVCYGHIFPHHKPTKVDGKWGKRGKAIKTTSQQESQESNMGHQDIDGPIDNTVGKECETINTPCYVEATDMTNKEYRELMASIDGRIWVGNQATKDRRKQQENNERRCAKDLKERNKMRATKGLPPLSQ